MQRVFACRRHIDTECNCNLFADFYADNAFAHVLCVAFDNHFVVDHAKYRIGRASAFFHAVYVLCAKYVFATAANFTLAVTLVSGKLDGHIAKQLCVAEVVYFFQTGVGRDQFQRVCALFDLYATHYQVGKLRPTCRIVGNRHFGRAVDDFVVEQHRYRVGIHIFYTAFANVQHQCRNAVLVRVEGETQRRTVHRSEVADVFKLAFLHYRAYAALFHAVVHRVEGVRGLSFAAFLCANRVVAILIQTTLAHGTSMLAHVRVAGFIAAVSLALFGADGILTVFVQTFLANFADVFAYVLLRARRQCNDATQNQRNAKYKHRQFVSLFHSFLLLIYFFYYKVL